MSSSATNSISARVSPVPTPPVDLGSTSFSHASATPPGDPEGLPPKRDDEDETPVIGRVPFWLFVFGSSTVVIALIISTLIHTGLFGIFSYVVMPPVRDDNAFELNARLVSVLMVEEPPEPEEAPPEPDPPIIEDTVPEPKNEPEPEPTPEPEPPAPEPPAEMLGHGLEGLGEGGIDLGPSGPGGGEFNAGSGQRGAGSGEREAAPERTREPRQRSGAVRLEDTSVPPKPLVQEPSLGYPREFREAGIEGRVVVQCIITEKGDVRACRHRSGPDELGAYAISIVRNWKFEPGQDHRGRAVPVAYTFRFPFRLR